MVTGTSILDARPASPRAGRANRARRSRAGALDMVLLAGLVAAVALIIGALHRQLVIDSGAAYARMSGFPAPRYPGRQAITDSFGLVSAVMLGSMTLAALRHRVAAISIFLLVAMIPLVQAVFGALPSESIFYRLGPTSLGGSWGAPNTMPQLAQVWRAFGIDYGLAPLPAIAIAAWTLEADTRDARPRSNASLRARLRMPTRSEAVGVAGSLFLFLLFLHTWELHETLQNFGRAPTIGTDSIAYLPFFLFGAVLARGSRWRLLALAAVPILWSTQWIPNLLAGEVHGPSMNDVHDALPFVAVVAAGALWRAIASAVEGDHARAWVLVVALNALNVADVLFTKAALHSGQAVEANPVAAWMGPGAKLIGVGIASVLLARFRPRALVWLVLAFGAVIAWHLSGAALNSS